MTLTSSIQEENSHFFAKLRATCEQKFALTTLGGAALNVAGQERRCSGKRAFVLRVHLRNRLIPLNSDRNNPMGNLWV